MKKFLQVSLLSAAALASSHAFANSPSWDYVELQYVQFDVDDIDVEPSGFGINGSVLVSENVFLTGSTAFTSDDFQGVDFDYDTLELGIGYRYAISDRTDWYASLSYANVEAKASASGFGSSTVDEDGFDIETGIRSMLTEKFELGADISYLDLGDEDETTFTVEATYLVSESVGIDLGYGIASDVNTLNLGVRFEF